MKQTGIETGNIENVMEAIRKLVGKEVRISVRESKPKTHWEEKEGVIEGCYRTLFLFRYRNSRNIEERAAYSYIDVAIEDVKVTEN